MSVASVTFDFEADAQGWTGTPMSADSTVARYQDTADWCFRHRIYGRNKGPDLNYAEVTDTWLNLFPVLGAGDTVTGVRFGGRNYKCDEFNVVTTCRYGEAAGVSNAVQYRGTSNVELFAGRAITGTTGWLGDTAGLSYETVPAGDQSPSTSVTFRCQTYQENANNAAAVSSLLWDDLVLWIEYTAASVRIPRSASMVPMLGG